PTCKPRRQRKRSRPTHSCSLLGVGSVLISARSLERMHSHVHVGRADRVSKGSNRNVVYSGFCVCPHVSNVNASRSLQRQWACASPDPDDGLSHLLHAHVVEQ